MDKQRLAIFDIDGTLTDSVHVHQSAFAEALETFGFSGFDTDWGSYKHHTDTFIFRTILEKQLNRDLIHADIARFEEILLGCVTAAVHEKRVTEIPGAGEFIEQLREVYGFDVVFATGSLLRPARLKLLQAGLSFHDELLVAANTVFSRDELVLSAIDRAKQYYGRGHYTHLVSFGDGLWDYRTALNLGIDFIGIANPGLIEHGVTSYFQDYTDWYLPELVKLTY